MSLMYFFLGLLLGVVGMWGLAQAARQVLQAQLSTTQATLATAQAQLATTQATAQEAAQEAARCQASHAHLQARLQEQQQAAATQPAALATQFKALAQDLLAAHSKQLTAHNQTQVHHLLQPLATRLQAFEQQVQQANQAGLERNVALRTELQQLSKLNAHMAQEALHLTQALKGSNKAQGQWGEFVLERLLEEAGLAKGREYSVQAAFTTSTGQRLQPDVIIHLPQDKHLLIDAKVSLVSYEQYCRTPEAAAQGQALQQHLQCVRRHIKTLSEKHYALHHPGQGLDFVLLFLPIEPAFGLAVQHAPGLLQEAYAKNIVLVSPSTLLATLRTIAHLWQQEKQQHNAKAIAQQGGALYDKFVGFVDDLTHLGRQLGQTQKTYGAAMNKLTQGQGNLVSKAQKLKTLGARASKSLPAPVLHRAEAPVTSTAA